MDSPSPTTGARAIDDEPRPRCSSCGDPSPRPICQVCEELRSGNAAGARPAVEPAAELAAFGFDPIDVALIVGGEFADWPSPARVRAARFVAAMSAAGSGQMISTHEAVDLLFAGDRATMRLLRLGDAMLAAEEGSP